MTQSIAHSGSRIGSPPARAVASAPQPGRARGRVGAPADRRAGRSSSGAAVLDALLHDAPDVRAARLATCASVRHDSSLAIMTPAIDRPVSRQCASSSSPVRERVRDRGRVLDDAVAPLAVLVDDEAAADGVVGAVEQRPAVGVERLERHPVRVRGQRRRRCMMRSSSGSKSIRCLPGSAAGARSAPASTRPSPGRCRRSPGPRPRGRAARPGRSRARGRWRRASRRAGPRTRAVRVEQAQLAQRRRRTDAAARIGPTVCDDDGPMPTEKRSRALRAIRELPHPVRQPQHDVFGEGGPRHHPPGVLRGPPEDDGHRLHLRRHRAADRELPGVQVELASSCRARRAPSGPTARAWFGSTTRRRPDRAAQPRAAVQRRPGGACDSRLGLVAEHGEPLVGREPDDRHRAALGALTLSHLTDRSCGKAHPRASPTASTASA